jgi:hypothetical protein
MTISVQIPFQLIIHTNPTTVRYTTFANEKVLLNNSIIINYYYTPTNALLYIVISLKFTLKHLKCSYMFRSSDHHQGAYTVPG